MAQPLTEKELAALPTQDYRLLRKDLRSGDLLFCSGSYPFSKLIKLGTGSAWSHVGIVFVLKNIDRVLLLESVESVGVRFAPLSKYVHDYRKGKPYDGKLCLARVKGVSARSIAPVAQFGIDELTRPYDNDEIARIAWRVMSPGRRRLKRDREYICSELVYECFDRAGKAFKPSDKGFVSPKDIWQDTDVRMLARIL